jgi:hypothetical protein
LRWDAGRNEGGKEGQTQPTKMGRNPRERSATKSKGKNEAIDEDEGRGRLLSCRVYIINILK